MATPRKHFTDADRTLIWDRWQRGESLRSANGWLKKRSKGNEERQVSHETIYCSLFIQACGALKKDLLADLRHPCALRRSRHHTQRSANHGRLQPFDTYGG